VLEVAAVGVPDKRLGEVVAAVVCPKPAFWGQLMEEELMEVARKGSVAQYYYFLVSDNLPLRLAFPNLLSL
jgi:acyl-CoA synthetase (AMP-forming)/AMP-acid ligase II